MISKKLVVYFDNFGDYEKYAQEGEPLIARSLLTIFLVLLTSESPVLAGYALIDLGIFSGDVATSAVCINDYGDIAGERSLSPTDPTQTKGFAWTGKYGMRMLSGDKSSVFAIGDGHFAGGCINTRSGKLPTIWNTDTGTIRYSLPAIGAQSAITSLMESCMLGWTTKKVGTSIKYYPCEWNFGGFAIATHTIHYEDGRPIELFAMIELPMTCDLLPIPSGLTGTGAGGNTINIETRFGGDLIVGKSFPDSTNKGFVYDKVNNRLLNLDAELLGVNALNEMLAQKIVDGHKTAFLISGSYLLPFPVGSDSPSWYERLSTIFSNQYSTAPISPLPNYTDTTATGFNAPFWKGESGYISSIAALERGINLSSIDRRNTQVVGYCDDPLGRRSAFVWTVEAGTKNCPE